MTVIWILISALAMALIPLILTLVLEYREGKRRR